MLFPVRVSNIVINMIKPIQLKSFFQLHFSACFRKTIKTQVIDVSFRGLKFKTLRVVKVIMRDWPAIGCTAQYGKSSSAWGFSLGTLVFSRWEKLSRDGSISESGQTAKQADDVILRKKIESENKFRENQHIQVWNIDTMKSYSYDSYFITTLTLTTYHTTKQCPTV